ncbi:hypothetical protein D3C80_1225440 [compost metagenome]
MQQSGDQGLIRITFDKTHDQFSTLSQRRDSAGLKLCVQRQPAMAGHRALSLIEPVELHRHRPAPVGERLIDIDHPRALQAVHPWFDGRTRRLEGRRPVKGPDLIVIRHCQILTALMADMSQQPKVITLRVRVTRQRHQLAAAQGCQVRKTLCRLHRRLSASLMLELTHGRWPTFDPEHHRLA